MICVKSDVFCIRLLRLYKYLWYHCNRITNKPKPKNNGSNDGGSGDNNNNKSAGNDNNNSGDSANVDSANGDNANANDDNVNSDSGGDDDEKGTFYMNRLKKIEYYDFTKSKKWNPMADRELLKEYVKNEIEFKDYMGNENDGTI